MDRSEFLKRIFYNPEGTEEYISENRSHTKSLYICLVAGLLMAWNTIVMQFVGEHILTFLLAALMYLCLFGVTKLTSILLRRSETLNENKKLKGGIIAAEIIGVTVVFNWLIIIYYVSFMFFLIFEILALVFGELYLAYKETFFDFYWLAYRKTEHADKRKELSQITSWYVSITGLIFSVVFFPLASAFMVMAQRGVGILLYGFLFLLWWVWSSALCTYILDKKIANNHLKNSLIAWGSNCLGIGHLIIYSQIVFIILQ